MKFYFEDGIGYVSVVVKGMWDNQPSMWVRSDDPMLRLYME